MFSIYLILPEILAFSNDESRMILEHFISWMYALCTGDSDWDDTITSNAVSN